MASRQIRARTFNRSKVYAYLAARTKNRHRAGFSCWAPHGDSSLMQVTVFASSSLEQGVKRPIRFRILCGARLGLARKCSASLLSWRTDQPLPTPRCVETIRPIMATPVAPQPNDADNPVGSLPHGHTTACSDWHWVGRFHVGTSHNSQRSLKMPDIRLQPFRLPSTSNSS